LILHDRRIAADEVCEPAAVPRVVEELEVSELLADREQTDDVGSTG
jgi:hypothetical protein